MIARTDDISATPPHPLENRQWPRWSMQNRVAYQIHETAMAKDAQLININCLGACLGVQDKIDPEATIRMTIYLSPGRVITVNGHIHWIKDDLHGYQVGVNFLELPTHVQDIIAQHVFELNRQSMVQHWFEGWAQPSCAQQ